MEQKTFTIKKGEKISYKNLTIINKGGGHKIFMDRSDKLYTDLSILISGKNIEDAMFFSDTKKLYSPYLISIFEIGWNGEYIKLKIEKIGEPKITDFEASDIASKYLRNNFTNTFDLSSINDEGDRFIATVYIINKKTLDTLNNGEWIDFISIDKITGKITEIYDKNKGFIKK
ncbi:MAG: hypothetical protein PHN31_00115 [Candidatus Gracilibacteria bacterium]|nr:hypothetical protein [Candidatus Gracilibacteria bacterium]